MAGQNQAIGGWLPVDTLKLLRARSSQNTLAGAGFLASGSSLPSSAFPRSSWIRVAAHARAPEEDGLAGYSGGTAQVFNLLPFSPSP